MKKGIKSAIFAGWVVWLISGACSRADEQMFAYNDSTVVLPKRGMEYEQHMTWKNGLHNTDRSFNGFEIRHELEYGLTDRLQTALYVDWNYQTSRSGGDRVRFSDVAWETIYQLTSPYTRAFGSAIYSEITWGPEEIELEQKLLLQKNIGDWTLVWNGVVAEKWAGRDYGEENGEVGQTVGMSYRLCNRLSVGMEAVHELDLAGWKLDGHNVVYAGPSLSFRTLWGSITVSPLAQISNVDDKADYQTRVIAEFEF